MTTVSSSATGSASTRLATLRQRAGYTQRDMARLTGLTRSTYWRLEKARYVNPPLRYVNNCAIVLGVDLSDVVEPVWLEWLGPPHTAAGAPAR